MLVTHVNGQQHDAASALAKMHVLPGWEVQLVASEPLVRQPVAIDFDDRGRLWVIQYLQYPNPAELRRVQVDRYSRTRYDRVPAPPPRGPRGADRITILSDSDGDGKMDQAKDFISGLNLASGFAFGHGGVFVLNVPYLLFYPDRDRDDVPDSEPEVLLAGFGMEDAHSVANSLGWGPDGWLYGCQGSTVTANIGGVEFQQGVWRYHPRQRKFELFCEGGGNSWGMDFDASGNLLYSTNYGGHVLLHAEQGGYFVKSFAKHGQLHNRFTYGYFDHAAHTNFQGGHVTVGGIIYQGDGLPGEMRGKFIAGDLLGHAVHWHDIHAIGSTKRTEHGGTLLRSDDTWFAPTDVVMGPEGAIYVSDWCDQRTAHPDPDADWDRTNGRIYRIAASGTKSIGQIDFSRLSTDQLLDLHQHPSQWFVRHARQELTARFVAGKLPNHHQLLVQLKKKLLASAGTNVHSSGQSAALPVEWLWTIDQLDGFDEALAMQTLESPDSAIRRWTIRLLGDRGTLSETMAHRLDAFAEQEPAVEVRSQIACSAARWPAHQAVPMINANINRDIDSDDPRLPLLWWWAVEKHSVQGREEVLKRFVRPSLWKSRLGSQILLPKLVRRYAAEDTAAGDDAVWRLLQAAPEATARRTLWPSVLAGLRERIGSAASTSAREPRASNAGLTGLLLKDWRDSPQDLTLIGLAQRWNIEEPLAHAKRLALDDQVNSQIRSALFNVLAEARDPSLVDPALAILDRAHSDDLRRAAISLLSSFEQPRVATAMLDRLLDPADSLRPQMIEMLVTRASFARAMLARVDDGQLPASTIPLDQVRRLALLEDTVIDASVSKHWGRVSAATAEEKLAEVRRLNNDLRAGKGDPQAGKLLFGKHCAACHQLFGEGKNVGPDLTSANRQDRDFLLVSLVDPSSVIRKEFVSLTVRTEDGRVLNGLPLSQGDAMLTLVDAKGETVVLPRSEIAEARESTASLMPDDLYRQFSPAQLRDLFSYLQRSP